MGFGEGLLLAVLSVGGQQSLLESVASIPARVVRTTEEQNRCQYLISAVLQRLHSDLLDPRLPLPWEKLARLGVLGKGNQLARSLHAADLVACSLSSSAHLEEINLSHL